MGLVHCVSSASPESTSKFSRIRHYDEITLTLPHRTAIPVRLPTYFPPYADEKNPVFAIVDSVSSHQYRVQLDWATDCEGGNWCHLGEITGSTAPPTIDGPMTPVDIGLGISGYFVKSSVGASCSDAMILWDEGGFHYSVAMKCAKRSVLVRMARSAILAGRRRP